MVEERFAEPVAGIGAEHGHFYPASGTWLADFRH
jgi:hypothetical protein